MPLDLRHHTFKRKPKFPKEWILTEERRAELARYRQEAELKDQSKLLSGQLVDGVKQIEQAFTKRAPEALPEMVMAGGTKGRGKTVSVRR